MTERSHDHNQTHHAGNKMSKFHVACKAACVFTCSRACHACMLHAEKPCVLHALQHLRHSLLPAKVTQENMAGAEVGDVQGGAGVIDRLIKCLLM